MTVAGEVKETTAQITRLIWADGKDGTPQWEVQLRWPWTPAANKGGDKTWVTQADFPQWTAATKGTVNLEVAAAYIRKAAEGKEPHDGHLPWMWHWHIRKVLDHAPAASAPAAASPGGGSQAPERAAAPLDQRIAWNSSVNNAVTILSRLSSFVVTLEPDNYDHAAFRAMLTSLAADIYPVIIAGPPQDVPAEAPSGATKPPEAPEPSRTPAAGAQAPQQAAQRPGMATVMASLNQWNDDVKRGAKPAGTKLLTPAFVKNWVYVKHAWNLDSLTPEQAMTLATAIANGEVK